MWSQLRVALTLMKISHANPAASVLGGQINLRDVELLQDLSPAEIRALEKRMPVKHVPPGLVLYSPDQPAEVLFLLKQGDVRLFHCSQDGKTFTTATVQPGEFFGEMALLGQKLYGNFAEAVRSCMVCVMSREDVSLLLLHDARIAYRAVEFMGRRLGEAERRLADMALRPVSARLACLLLQLANAAGDAATSIGPIEVTCTHDQLALSVGAYRETVTKVLNEWRLQGLLELRRGRILLLDRERLNQLCAD